MNERLKDMEKMEKFGKKTCEIEQIESLRRKSERKNKRDI